MNEAFSQMPLAGLVNHRVLCMHGGISELLTKFSDIRKPMHDPQEVPPLVTVS